MYFIMVIDLEPNLSMGNFWLTTESFFVIICCFWYFDTLYWVTSGQNYVGHNKPDEASVHASSSY
ncbi:hypothetical protein H5410_043956 [Solanum commersonii]|uniref:Uncharacterized protein n=1 Tax=Solanum commersonii TaxID=4109 RepID=A0A9J5Y0D6_SOLCO|nr:hypothetical protein H5410_043956 [Solanum commersonii]